MFYIYKITNITNGKSYIGFSQDIKQRIRQHRMISNRENPKQHIHRAIKKYGWDNFTIEVIDQSEDKNYALDILEPKYIEQFKTMTEGYNMTKGGDGVIGYKYTDKQKQIISEKTKIGMSNEELKTHLSEKAKERWNNPEYRNHMSEVHKGYKPSKENLEKRSLSLKGKQNALGYKHTEEARRKISEAAKRPRKR